MATRIESGQMQLRGAGGVPMVQVQGQPVDFIAPRVQAQESNVLAQTLDRLTSTLFQKAGEQRQQEGSQYVADNPPTPKQLQAAMNGDTSELGRTGENLTGSTLNIFDKAVAKARSFQLSSAFESEGLNQLLKVHEQVKLGTMTAEDARAQIKAVSDGLLPKNFSEIDAEAALKFRATIATHGNTVLRDAYRIESERKLEQRQIQISFDLDNKIKMLDPIVAQGSFFDGTQQQPVDKLALVMREAIAKDAIMNGLSAEKMESNLAKFDNAFRQAKINAVTRELMKPQYLNDPMGTLSKIRSGTLGNLSPILQDMTANDFDAVARTTANFMVAANNQKSLSDAQRDDAKRGALMQFIPLYQQAVAIKDFNNPTRKKLTQQISLIAQASPDSVPLSVLKDLLEPPDPKAAESNAKVEFNVGAQIESGAITRPDQIWAFVGKGLTGKDAVSLAQKLYSTDRRNDSELERGINQRAGIQTAPGVVVSLEPNAVQWSRRAELKAQAERLKADAAGQGKILTNTEILEKIDQGIAAARNTAGAQQARDQLKQFQTRLGMDRTPTASDLPSLREKYKNDPGKLRDITRVEQLLRQAEGGQ